MVSEQDMMRVAQSWRVPWNRIGRFSQQFLCRCCHIDKLDPDDWRFVLDGYRSDSAGALGRGAFGVSFVVQETRGVPKVLKLFEGQVSADTEAVLGLIREVDAGIRLRSEYVAQYERLVVRPGNGARQTVCYIVRQYLEGVTAGYQSLANVNDLRPVFDALAQGVLDMHEAGIIHRDLKPSNAIIAGSTAAWTDLGTIAHVGSQRVGSQNAGLVPVRGHRRPPWVPWEAWTGRQIDYTSWSHLGDIFAFGVTIFQMTVPQGPLWDGHRELSGEPKAVFMRSNRLDDALKRSVLEMVRPEPLDRRSMRAIIEGLSASAPRR